MRWRALPAAARVAIVIVGIVVGVNVAISALDSATRGADTEGTDSDPSSTAPNGTAAWVELLEHNGVDISSGEAGAGGFEPGASLMMLGVEELSLADAVQVRELVSAGGRLIVG